MLVANGQGESAVSSPSRNTVHTGVELLSNNVCSQSIASPYYFNMSFMVFTSPSLNTSGDLRAFPKAN